MKLIINTGDLKAGLDVVGAAVAGATTIPVLSGVLLEVSENVLRLSASDLEKDITTLLKCQGEDGAIVLPYKLLSGLIGGLNGAIEMNLNPSNLTMKWESGEQNGSIKGLDPGLFPDVTYGDSDYDITFEGEQLAEAIARVVVSSGDDSGREWLASVNMRLNDETEGKLFLQGANGFKASIQTMAAPGMSSCEAVIPVQSISRITQLASKSKNVGIRFVGKDVIFVFDQVVWLRSSTLEAKYPDLTVFIPESSLTSIRVDKVELLRKLNTARLFCSETSMVEVKVGEDTLLIQTRSAELGDYSGDVQCSLKGDPIFFGANINYFIQGVAVIPGDEVLVEAKDADSIIAMRPGEDVGFIFCMTPMHVVGSNQND